MGNKFKKTAWNFYSQWRKEKCFCPALSEEVTISLVGWYHLTGQKGNKKRVWNDVYRRLLLLEHAKEIIKTSTTIQNISVKNGRRYYVLEAMRLVNEKGRKEWRKVRVILIESKSLKKIFLSVMDKKNPPLGR